MLIRPYRPMDRREVLALQDSADVDLNATVPDDFYSDLDDIESAYVGGVFLVAEVNGAIAGMGGLLSTGEIVRMRVHAEHRRQGLATRILASLIDRARDLGMKRVFLHTLQEQAAAQRLYVAHGFEEVGRGRIHGNPVVAYQRSIA
jgi:GNAT superfamily N-acetyltransferase